jgi:hypothetical protein
MARVPSVPNPGQPIDTTYINSIVESLISINNELASNGYSYIDNGVSSSVSNIRTGNVVISARTITNLDISNGKTYKVGEKTPSTTISFKNNSSFTKPPIVTATLLNIGDSSAQFILTISAVTTGGFNYSAYCIVAGTAKYNLSFNAIGA